MVLISNRQKLTKISWYKYFGAKFSKRVLQFSNRWVATSRQNWRLSNWIRYETGTTNALRCQVPIWRDHTIGPKPRKMPIIIPRRWRGTWEGVPIATWCSEWICRTWGGSSPHILIFPASLSLPPMRGAVISRAPTILHDDSFYQNIQSCQISNFVDH